jgi:prepilin-type N-terminal cleavage/methylation domain-containing protein
MKNKGFTLVELLAIIVIISVITLITIPIVKNIIDESKENTAINSAYGFKEAVHDYYIDSTLDEEINLEGIYTVSNGTINGPSVSSVAMKVKGTKPTAGRLIYKNSEMISGCLEIEGYKIRYVDEQFMSDGKGTCTPNFQEDSWDVIKKTIELDKTAYALGSEKRVKMNLDGTERIYTLRLVNTSTPSDCNGLSFSQTGCGVIIEFATVIGTYPYYETQPETNTGWYGSTLRTLLNSGNNSIYNKLPEDLKAVIIPTEPIISSKASGADALGTMGDYLFIEAPKELGRTAGTNGSTDKAKDKTRTFDYYTISGVSRQKYTVAGDETEYWSRSMYSDNTTQAWRFDINGSVGNRTAIINSIGVAPAFKIAN